LEHTLGTSPVNVGARAREPLETQAIAMWSILILAAVIGGLILVMGLLSLFEGAVVGTKRWRVREEASRGDHRARAVLRFTENLDHFVGAMRLGITLAATAAGVCTGILIWRMGDPARIRPGAFPSMTVGVTAIVILLAIVFFGDFLPRRMAGRWPERVACKLARLLAWYMLVAGPVAGFLGRMADFLARLLGVKPTARALISHDEIKGLIWEGAKAGVFDEAEHEIFKRVFRFCDRRARALMTPRDQVVWIDVADSPEEIRRKVLGSAHSRFPVCDESLDNLLGIVQVRDLLSENSGGSAFRVKGHLTVPALIYEGARGPKVLEILRTSSTHTAVVLDEFGLVVGMLTLSDILGAVLGAVPEKGTDDEEPRSVQRDDGSWLLDGRFPADEFRDLFGLIELPEGDYQTLAGLVVNHLGHIPHIAETFELLGLRFEIVDMDAKRVDRVLISRASGFPP
jgi:magnesium and cobalt exporter, CNNM family